ncbi:MAG: helix-turn-helix domain-containing protein [Prolixibacteraceae bacterium]
MSDLDQGHNSKFDKKIVAGLERLSQVFRTLLWEKAKEHHLSPIQIQILIFIYDHSPELNTVSYFAKEFQVTKPTISDAVRVLEQKKLVSKNGNLLDSRRFSIALTESGEKIVDGTRYYTAPIMAWTEQLRTEEKESLWRSVSDLIRTLNQTGIVTIYRTCYTCHHYRNKEGLHFCSLLEEILETRDIQIDCPDFKLTENL